MNNFDWISEYESKKIFQTLLNILFVWKGARKSTLVEWNDFTPEEREIYEPLGMEFVKKLGLFTLPDPFSDYRVFVVKNKNIKNPETDEEIGALLEFVCKGHEYFNQDLNRILISIKEVNTEAEVYVEICEKDKIKMDILKSEMEKKINHFDNAMKSLNLKYRFKYDVKELTSRKELLENYRNKEYLKKHLEDYGNLLMNEFHENTKFSKNPNLILDKMDPFFFIMNMIQNGELEQLYQTVTPLTKEYYELLKALEILENQMLKG